MLWSCHALCVVWFDSQACTFLYDESIEVHALVIAELPDASGTRFEVQRSGTFDEQDRTLGMDQYCLMMDSGASHYGGVIGWHVDEANVLRVTLDDRAATALATSSIEIALRPQDSDVVSQAIPALLHL